MKARLQEHLPEGAKLLGRLDRADLLDRMGRAHILVVTSVREGWGLVVTEANSLGTPAVAYDVPGLRDAVKNNSTGVLVRPSPAEAAVSIVNVLRDGDRYDRLKRDAQLWGAQCSWDKTAATLLSLLTETVQGKHSSAA